MGMINDGGYSQFALLDAERAIPLDDSIDFNKATALLVQGLTAMGLLKNVKENSTVLIHAAAGGVGSLAVQIAKLKGATVIGTTSTEEKTELIKRLGADHVVNYKENNWTENIQKLTHNKGVDLILEMVGGEIGAKSVDLLAKGGNMIVFGAASGEPTQIFAHQLMQKGSSVTGYSLFNENPADMIEFTKKLFEYVGSGKLEIILDAYPFADVKKAQHDMQSRLTKGKVVLSQE